MRNVLENKNKGPVESGLLIRTQRGRRCQRETDQGIMKYAFQYKTTFHKSSKINDFILCATVVRHRQKTLRISVYNISHDDSVRDRSVDQQQFSSKSQTTTNLPDTNGDSIALLHVLEKQEIYGEISQENG